MSTPQHAPAPWQVHHDIDAAGYPYFVLHGFSGQQKHDKAMLDATAEMIAAAPDLYSFVASRADSGDKEALKLLESINGHAKGEQALERGDVKRMGR